MKKVLYILITFLLLNFICCQKNRVRLDFEKEVMREVSIPLIDSFNYYSRRFPPPFPKIIYDNENNFVGFDTIDRSEVLTEYKIKKNEFMNDPKITRVMAVLDSTDFLTKHDVSEFIKYYKEIEVDTLNYSKVENFDLNSLSTKDNIIFKYTSEFPKGTEIWQGKYDFKLMGALRFSNILFDNNKVYGVFTSGYHCDPRCGVGYRVFISFKNGKWRIDKFERIWIS